MDKKYVLDGFAFPNASEYERAKKEKETVAYLSANTDMTNLKEVYQVYRKAVEKRSFQTVFGWNYMEELRNRLVGSEIVSEEALDAIPVGIIRSVAENTGDKTTAQTEKKIKEYQEAYQKAKAGSVIKNFLIVVLALVVAAMLFISFRSEYSVLTYFTNYEYNIRNKVVNEYEDWEKSLNKKEKELEQKEKELEQKQVQDTQK